MNNRNLSFPTKQDYLLLDGNAGNIELLISPANPEILQSGTEIIAIICHPHPLHCGTMDNKVVYTTHKALSSFGCHTIRFNFRGVGRSEGKHDHSVGETEDLLTIISWVNNVKPNCKIILAGFSFGAFVAFKASQSDIFTNEQQLLCLISIAPAVNNQHYDQSISKPWLIIQGDQDEVVPADLVFQLAENLSPKPDLIKFANTGHFFHGRLPELKAVIIEYLKNRNFYLLISENQSRAR